MNKYNKLAKNTGIFFIANFGSKVLSFLFVRFYTELLSVEEYGIIDLLHTTASLAVPIITLCITEAVLRFSIDDETNRGKILTNGLFTAVLGNALFVFTAPLLVKVEAFSDNIMWIYLLSVSNSVYMITSHFARGIGNSKLFALSGILHTIFQIALNIILLAGLSLGIKGYLVASVLSNFVVAGYVFFRGNLYRYIIKGIDKKYLKAMLIYAIPLVPNSVFWWIMQSSNRYMITFLLSATHNGLYAVANKIPTLITTISSIFFQAWQISAVEDANSDDRAKFYTNIFQILSSLITIASSGVLIILQPLYKILTEESYYSGWTSVPFLLCATIFSCYASFLGTNYVAMKKTKGVFLTTVIGAVVNVSFNFLLIPYVGIRGTAISTFLAFFVTWLVRAIDTRKFVKIEYSPIQFIIPTFILLLQSILLTFGVETILLQITLFIVIVVCYIRSLKTLIGDGINMLKKKGGK